MISPDEGPATLPARFSFMSERHASFGAKLSCIWYQVGRWHDEIALKPEECCNISHVLFVVSTQTEWLLN